MSSSREFKLFMFPLASVLIFALGAIVGSFLNVVIYRHHAGMHASILSGRSKCLSCNARLSWGELVPIVSFALQGGKCRSCKVPISLQYPLVEVATGILFFLTYTLHLTPYTLLFYWVVASLFVVIAAYDMRHKIIPDAFVYALGILILIYLGSSYFMGAIGASTLFWHTLAGFILAAPFALLWLVSRGRWIGLGDAKLTLVIGWMLGISQGLAAVLLGIWTGAIVGVILVAVAKMGRGFMTLKSEIPFGPFLIFGAFAAMFSGLDIFSVLAWFT